MIRHKYIGLALIFCFLTAGCLTHEKNKYTTTYENVTPQEAYNLIKNDSNLIVVDVRGCPCHYNKEHLPHAIWDTNVNDFYNTTKDLLIYCETGYTSTQFCKKLVGHVYGRIYNLEGGIEAWKKAGYEVEKG